MGTNYYWHELAPCGHCGRTDKPRHIGKNSAGWVFALHVYPDEGIHDLSDWQEMFARPGSKIEDEYGDRVSAEEMLEDISARKGYEDAWEEVPYPYNTWGDFHQKNHSQQGPDNLLRSKINEHCIGHGAGTWDLFVGEFS